MRRIMSVTFAGGREMVSAQCLTGEAYAIITRPPIACMNRRLPCWYVEALSDARTTLEGFCSVLR